MWKEKENEIDWSEIQLHKTVNTKSDVGLVLGPLGPSQIPKEHDM